MIKDFIVLNLEQKFPNHSFEFHVHANPLAGSFGYPNCNHYPYYLMDGDIFKINIWKDDLSEEETLKLAINYITSIAGKESE